MATPTIGNAQLDTNLRTQMAQQGISWDQAVTNWYNFIGAGTPPASVMEAAFTPQPSATTGGQIRPSSAPAQNSDPAMTDPRWTTGNAQIDANLRQQMAADPSLTWQRATANWDNFVNRNNAIAQGFDPVAYDAARVVPPGVDPNLWAAAMSGQVIPGTAAAAQNVNPDRQWAADSNHGIMGLVQDAGPFVLAGISLGTGLMSLAGAAEAVSGAGATSTSAIPADMGASVTPVAEGTQAATDQWLANQGAAMNSTNAATVGSNVNSLVNPTLSSAVQQGAIKAGVNYAASGGKSNPLMDFATGAAGNYLGGTTNDYLTNQGYDPAIVAAAAGGMTQVPTAIATGSLTPILAGAAAGGVGSLAKTGATYLTDQLDLNSSVQAGIIGAAQGAASGGTSAAVSGGNVLTAAVIGGVTGGFSAGFNEANNAYDLGIPPSLISVGSAVLGYVAGTAVTPNPSASTVTNSVTPPVNNLAPAALSNGMPTITPVANQNLATNQTGIINSKLIGT